MGVSARCHRCPCPNPRLAGRASKICRRVRNVGQPVPNQPSASLQNRGPSMLPAKTVGPTSIELGRTSIFTFSDAGAGPSQLKVGTAETILRQGVRHLRHAPVPANCLSSPPPSAGCHAKSRYRNGVGRASIETELGEPVLKKKSETPPDPLGEPVLKKNPKPLQTRWANQYLKKRISGPLGEPVSKRSWANQYQKRSWADEPGGLGGPSPTRWVSKNSTKTPAATLRRFFDDRWQHQKTGNIFTFFDAGAGPSQLKVGTAETILRQGVRHLRHLRHPLNVERECLKRVSDLSQQ